MKFEGINKKYTEKVAEWMANGYTINAATMSGHQGEIAKIDLTDGKDIIRIMLTSKTEHGTGERLFECFDYIELVVGKAQAENYCTPNSPDTFGQTFWNQLMDVLYTEKFYEIGRHRNSKWYGTREEAIAQQDKMMRRYKSRDCKNTLELPEKAKEIVLPFMRRQFECKSIRLSQIEKVVKKTTDSGTYYIVHAKGKTYKMS